MTVYTYPDPGRAAVDFGKTKVAGYPAGTTVSANFPTALTAPHVQVAWDGTPDARQQVETAAIRVTVWAPKGQGHVANDLASKVRKDFLEFTSASVWRSTPGAGRTPGVDPDTGLPFCTFSVNVDIRPA